MANTLAALFKITNPILTQSVLRCQQTLYPQAVAVRFLYAKGTLGLDGFLDQRERTKNQLVNVSPKFREKMHEYTSSETKNMIFTEDLKNMVHIAESDDDVELVIKMMNKFNQQNQQLRFGSFIFGSVVMRMFHVLNKYEDALACFKNPQLEGFFDQLISYQILLDMLYENGTYNEILDAFELIKGKQLQGIRYPKNVIVLVFAACYKLNSDESLKYALTLWSELGEIGHLPMRRAATFCAGLALNQGKPDVALEVVSSIRNQNYTTVRNLKVAALADVGRCEDALPILRSVLHDDNPIPTNTLHTYNKDVLDKVKKAIENQGSDDIKLEFSRIDKFFQQQGHVADLTLDQQLCMEIVSPPSIIRNKDNQPRFSRYQQRENYRNRSEYRSENRYENRYQDHRAIERPGLTDLQ